MTATVEQARDEMNALLKDALGSTQIVWDDVPANVPNGPAPWARVTVRHNAGGQATLSRQAGLSRYNRTGTIYVNLFAMPGDGLRVLDPLTKMALDALEGKTTPSGIWLTQVRVRELGIVKGWYQVNVLANFSYDEIK